MRAVSKQYLEYGRWKRSVVRRHPRSLRWRQVVPPAVTVAVIAGAATGLVWRKAWLVPKALLLPAGYTVAVAAAAMVAGTSPGRRARLLAIFPTMHLSWGAGFLLGEPHRVY